VARGLTGVRVVISDAHPGLVDAIASTLPGPIGKGAGPTSFGTCSRRSQSPPVPFVATLVRSIFAQPDGPAVHAEFARVPEQLPERFPAAAEMLAEAGPDIVAFTSFPQPNWRQIWSNDPQERLNKEIRHRTDVVGIFPNRDFGDPARRDGAGRAA
jgi:putative transposase